MLAKIAAYALGLAGTALMVHALVKVAAMNVKYVFHRFTLIQALRTNARLAHMQCNAKPGTFYEPVGAAMTIIAQSGVNDAASVTQMTKPAFDGAVVGVTVKWKMLFGTVKKAALLPLGGLALAISKDNISVFLILLSVGAAGAFLYIYAKKTEVERSLVLARAEILPEVENAFIEGRYR